ncbi:Obscurin [Trachymyrmex cornetzi]|uniref:Obscurin n=1 Tax=Trachymyrmex cornetzi TaxID=471704 RepID=A0A195E207_9HYME|nr:Obscurin [Trachymyrmex cornetzi]
MFAVSQAKHQQNSSANNAIASLNAPEGKNEDVLEGPIGEVLAQSGTTAVLPCKITDPGAGTITWVRRRDRQLLTVGTSTHSIDKRFVVRHSSTDWQLTIRTVTVDDAGIYECQVTSHPVQRNFARLKITEAYSIIPGAPDLHVKQGSNLRLECQLMAATEKPLYVFWYRQGRMINYDEEPGVDVKLTSSGSILTVNKTKLTHEGNYTCVPSNAKAAFVMVHVIEAHDLEVSRTYVTRLSSEFLLQFTHRFTGYKFNKPFTSTSDNLKLSSPLRFVSPPPLSTAGGEASGNARGRQKEPQPGNFGEQLSRVPPGGRQLEDTEFHEPLPDVNYRRPGGILRPACPPRPDGRPGEETSSRSRCSTAWCRHESRSLLT